MSFLNISIIRRFRNSSTQTRNKLRLIPNFKLWLVYRSRLFNLVGMISECLWRWWWSCWCSWSPTSPGCLSWSTRSPPSPTFSSVTTCPASTTSHLSGSKFKVLILWFQTRFCHNPNQIRFLTLTKSLEILLELFTWTLDLNFGLGSWQLCVDGWWTVWSDICWCSTHQSTSSSTAFLGPIFEPFSSVLVPPAAKISEICPWPSPVKLDFCCKVNKNKISLFSLCFRI